MLTDTPYSLFGIFDRYTKRYNNLGGVAPKETWPCGYSNKKGSLKVLIRAEHPLLRRTLYLKMIFFHSNALFGQSFKLSFMLWCIPPGGGKIYI